MFVIASLHRTRAGAQVIVAASSLEDFVKWSGYMNSRVKLLTARMHNVQGQLLARPWPKEFKVPMCAPPFCASFSCSRALLAQVKSSRCPPFCDSCTCRALSLIHI